LRNEGTGVVVYDKLKPEHVWDRVCRCGVDDSSNLEGAGLARRPIHIRIRCVDAVRVYTDNMHWRSEDGPQHGQVESQKDECDH